MTLMSGPADNLAKGWNHLRKGVDIDTPGDIEGQASLGLQYDHWEIKLSGGVAAPPRTARTWSNS